MGMIIAFNALMGCLVTGLFTALFILLFIKMGWMPTFIIIQVPEGGLDEQDETDV